MKNKIKKKVKYFTAVIQTIIGLGWIEVSTMIRHLPMLNEQSKALKLV